MEFSSLVDLKFEKSWVMGSLWSGPLLRLLVRYKYECFNQLPSAIQNIYII